MKHKNGIFKNSAEILHKSISHNLINFLNENNQSRYNLLIDNSVSERILNGEIKNIDAENYYSHSKEGASSKISNLLKCKEKYSDGIIELICENIDKSIDEIVWLKIPTKDNNYNSYLFYLSIIIPMLYDAFCSDDYHDYMKNYILEYYDFSDITIKKIQGTYKSIEEYHDIMRDKFNFIFQNKLAIKFDKIARDKGFNTFHEYFLDFFRNKKNPLRNIEKYYSEFFILMKKEFLDCTGPNPEGSDTFAKYYLNLMIHRYSLKIQNPEIQLKFDYLTSELVDLLEEIDYSK
jgi:hypothetical protein